MFSSFSWFEKGQTRQTRHPLKMDKKRRENSKSNYYIISRRIFFNSDNKSNHHHGKEARETYAKHLE